MSPETIATPSQGQTPDGRYGIAMAKYPVTRRFESSAQEMLREAESRGELIYGVKPWYCSASLIERGAEVAFVGANPGGRSQSEADDSRLGILERPYDDESLYNAWLDDTHWEGDGGHQQRVAAAFEILFGSSGRDTLRKAACLNVVPLRTSGTNDMSTTTWNNGVNWVSDVLEHVQPGTVICNGNGSARSAWSAINVSRFGIEAIDEKQVYGTFRLKRGRIARGALSGAEVIGLPHLARMKSIPQLQQAVQRLEPQCRIGSLESNTK